MYVIGKEGDFQTITEALANYTPNPYGPTVFVIREGTYCEQIHITGDNIRLVGESIERTIICTEKDGEELTFSVSGEHVELEHVTIKGPIPHGKCLFRACVHECGEEKESLNSAESELDNTPTWWVCGDSTSAICTPEYAPQMNWTMILPERMKGIAYLHSCAVSGRSTKSFVAEGRLGLIELCMREGDKLLIQFSHNDEKAPRDLGTHARLTFPCYLDMYIDAARSHGAEPVLLTAFERRIVDEEGRLTYSHRDYPHAIRDHALARGVRLIDMEKASRALYEQMGLEEAKALFMWIPAGHPNYPDGAKDNTHFSARGAEELAELFRMEWNASEQQRCSVKPQLIP